MFRQHSGILDDLKAYEQAALSDIHKIRGIVSRAVEKLLGRSDQVYCAQRFAASFLMTWGLPRCARLLANTRLMASELCRLNQTFPRVGSAFRIRFLVGCRAHRFGSKGLDPQSYEDLLRRLATTEQEIQDIATLREQVEVLRRQFADKEKECRRQREALTTSSYTTSLFVPSRHSRRCSR